MRNGQVNPQVGGSHETENLVETTQKNKVGLHALRCDVESEGETFNSKAHRKGLREKDGNDEKYPGILCRPEDSFLMQMESVNGGQHQQLQ